MSAAAITAMSVPLYVVADRVIGTDLFWNRERAHLFVKQRRSGWQGNHLQYAWEMVKNKAGFGTKDSDTLTWVTVYQLTSSSVDRHVIDVADAPGFRVVSHEIYGMYNGKPARWSSGVPVVITSDEWSRITTAKSATGEYTDVDGWSRRINLLPMGRVDRQIAFTLDAHPVTLASVHGASEGFDRLYFDDLSTGKRQELWVLEQPRRVVTAQEYSRLFEPHQ